MPVTKVHAYDRADGTHVRQHPRRTGGRMQRTDELPPEEPHEVDVRVHVEGHESHSKAGSKERVRPYSYDREEKRFGGHSKELYRKVYREYRAKGYSNAESKRIAGGTVGDVYRAKLREGRK